MNQRISFIPDTKHECLKVVRNIATFNVDKIVYEYHFETKTEARKWKNERSISNHKDKYIEEFQCCNELGEYSFEKYYKLCKAIGAIARKPTTLTALKACNEVLGIKQTHEEEIEAVLNNCKEEDVFKRVAVIKNTPTSKKTKLKQLTDASNLPEHMGELFLNEIKLSTDEANRHLRDRAKILGLY